MAKKRKGNGRTNGKQWFTTSEAARYLGVSVDKVRQLDESGELRASRTEGKHRRFARRALDAYLARHSRRSKPKSNQPKFRPRPIPRPHADPEPFDDDVDAFEPGDEDFEPYVEPPPPPRPPNPLEQLEREMAERRKREAEEAPLRRLVTLKQYGLGQVPYGTPDIWRAKVASALEAFVTLKTFPSWINDTQAYAIVRGKVEEALQPFHEEATRKKAEQAHQDEEAARKQREQEEEASEARRIQELIDDGMRHARSETLFEWESEDRDRALRDVERMLKDSVESDWTEGEVKDAVNDELDEWEEDDPEADEEDES